MKIMTGIKAWCHTKVYLYLIKHPFLDALQYAFRNRKNPEKCAYLAGRDGKAFRCISYGNMNPKKNIYYIKYGAETSGFFVQYRRLLKYLCVADRFGFEPVVEWDMSLPYAEKNGVNGVMNPFEYYFEQPAGITITEAMDSYNVFMAEEIQMENSFLNEENPEGEQGYWMSESFMDRLAGASKRYIRLNKEMHCYMKNEIGKLLQGKKTVGVHFRGSDYKKNYHNHPIAIHIDEYIDELQRMLKENEYEQIFLATDDINAIEVFQGIFGNKIIYYEDVKRTDSNISVAFSNDGREHHKYLLGREVLRDMLTLAECDALVAGISQVSICAQITKKSYGFEYDNIYIINKGFNSNLKYFDK